MYKKKKEEQKHFLKNFKNCLDDSRRTEDDRRLKNIKNFKKKLKIRRLWRNKIVGKFEKQCLEEIIKQEKRLLKEMEEQGKISRSIKNKNILE